MYERHGMTGTKLHNTWFNMKSRCYNPKRPDYSNYGGKGITVYQSWLDDFTAFMNWSLENGYNDDLTLDRIDPHGDYTPDNCRWISIQEQQRNRGNNITVMLNGEFLKLHEVSEKYGVPLKMLRKRYHAGKRGVDLVGPKRINQFV